MPSRTDILSFPAGFRTQDVPTNGTTLHVRIGGQGPAALLLHGYGETGDMWGPLAANLSAITPWSRPAGDGALLPSRIRI